MYGHSSAARRATSPQEGAGASGLDSFLSLLVLSIMNLFENKLETSLGGTKVNGGSIHHEAACGGRTDAELTLTRRAVAVAALEAWVDPIGNHK